MNKIMEHHGVKHHKGFSRPKIVEVEGCKTIALFEILYGVFIIRPGTVFPPDFFRRGGFIVGYHKAVPIT